jgi:hypothetical protein
MGMAHDTPLPLGLECFLMGRSYTRVILIWIAELIGLYAVPRYFS